MKALVQGESRSVRQSQIQSQAGGLLNWRPHHMTTPCARSLGGKPNRWPHSRKAEESRGRLGLSGFQIINGVRQGSVCQWARWLAKSSDTQEGSGQRQARVREGCGPSEGTPRLPWL